MSHIQKPFGSGDSYSNYYSAQSKNPPEKVNKEPPKEPEDVVMTDAWVEEEKPTRKFVVERRAPVFPHNLDSFIAQILQEKN